MLFDTKGHCFERQIIMLNVRWYLSYKLSYRDLEEMARERGLEVDHTTIYRWVIKFTPGLEKAVRRLKRPSDKSWYLPLPGGRQGRQYRGLSAHGKARWKSRKALSLHGHQVKRRTDKNHHRQKRSQRRLHSGL